MIDTRDLRPGDVLSWRVWTGETATARVTYVGRFSYSQEAPDGYSESLDHHIRRATVTRAESAQ